MKKILLILIVSFLSIKCTSENTFSTEIPYFDSKENDWELFIDAVIWRESRGDCNAIGDDGKAVGVLQLHKIMVDDANRISKINNYGKVFTYQDRYDREKSIEIFNIVQRHYNKNFNHEKALKIWNSGHSNNYKEEIFEKYQELKLT